jgi:hypothetical protein
LVISHWSLVINKFNQQKTNDQEQRTNIKTNDQEQRTNMRPKS